MKKITSVAAAIAAFGFVSAASAADIPVKAVRGPIAAPVYDWSGIYIGGSVGGLWHDIIRTSPGFPAGVINEYTTSGSDAIWGVHAGIQKQWGHWVIGIEAALNNGFKTLESKNGPLGAPFAADLGYRNTIRDLFTVGPRVGYAWDQWLLFVTGGLASAKLNGEYYTVSTGASVFPTFWGSSTNYGWFGGIGVEYVLMQGSVVDWIIGAEYQHYSLQSKRAFTESPAAGFDDSFDLKSRGDLVRARLSVKFKGIP